MPKAQLKLTLYKKIKPLTKKPEMERTR